MAAYCRVSTIKEDQEDSFESQVAYYTMLISKNVSYEMAGIYADQGFSGTNMENRPEFMRMINDAMSGKIDVIYCKSISRFGRNAAQCQEMVRKLKDKMVEVIFEREQLSSFNPMSEMVFNFLTILAQEESRSISENTIWALDRLAEKGIRKLGMNRVFGYDEIKGKLVPNSYAPAVKMIFEEYAKGTKVSTILKYLNQMGVVSVNNRKPLKCQTIKVILTNVIYKGERIIQKKPHPNYLTKKPDYTREFNQYYITEAHEPIVSIELWDACQKERKRRMRKHTRGNPAPKPQVRFRGTSHPLFGKVVCAECGSPYERKTLLKKGIARKMWRCKKKKGECHNHIIYEDKLLEAVGEIDFSMIERIIVSDDRSVSIEYKKVFVALESPYVEGISRRSRR